MEKFIYLSDGGLWSNILLKGLYDSGIKPCLVVKESKTTSTKNRIKYRIKKYGFLVVLIWLFESLYGTIKNKKIRNIEEIVLPNELVVKSVNSKESIEKISQLKPCFIINAVSSIVSSKLLEIPQLGVFGCHQGLLPKYTGLSSVHWHVYDGVIPGFTIFKLIKEIDKGPIFFRQEVVPNKNEKYFNYLDRFHEEMKNFFIQIITMMYKDRYSPKPLDIEYVQPLNRGLKSISSLAVFIKNWKKMT